MQRQQMPQLTTTRMPVFTLIWFGQLISLIGSGLTGFALGIWVYQRTGSATQFALITVFTTLPRVVISPIAGALVDRWQHRWVMIVSDLGTGLSIGAIALLLRHQCLEIWHLYVLTAVSSIFSAFHLPAYTAATTLLVPKHHLGRANGMIQLAGAVTQLISPILAGLLLVTIQLQGIILLDFTTFLFALLTLLLVRFPNTKTTASGKLGLWVLLHEAAYGWSYITSRPGLFGLLIFLSANYFLMGVVLALSTPLVLSFASPTTLGVISSIGGIGFMIGSLVMSTWGRKKRYINSVFTFMLLNGLCMVVIGFHPFIPVFALSLFLISLGMPLINGSIQVIFQKKVELHVQGRIFSFNSVITQVGVPLAYVVAGPLADHVFQPLVTTNGLLAGSIGQIIGVGPGRGIALVFIVMGILCMLTTVVAYQYPHIRLVEDELPDAIAEEASVRSIC